MSTGYPDSVRFLYALGNEFKTIKFGLERIQTLLDALGRPQDACRFIHVAGTNGKGSTCAMIESGLRCAGYRTGLYTSPHLVEPAERIQINGEPVSDGDFNEAFEEVHYTAGRMLAAGEIDMHPTYFETITAMGLVLFRRLRAGRVVLETGMGGRLDATNIVTPELAVITPVDFDHEKFLGETIPEIAWEKAGIIKPGCPVVLARQRPEAQDVLESRAAELGAPVTRASDWTLQDCEVHAYGSRFRVHGPSDLNITCPLIGEHQVENALTAAAALHLAGLSPRHIEEGIAGTRWPGRLELVQQSPSVFLDGAHNPAGAEALARYIKRFHAGKKIWIVFAAMRDKDVNLIGNLLFPLAARLIFTAPANPRAFLPAELRDLTGQSSAILAPSALDVLALIRDVPPQDVVFITGSLYLVGEVRPLLCGHPKSA
ncbi:MAG: bifunctional folylpolyglutamate synthase/dihydrofolate synthase [Bryobacterales bacterium]|nr:bifunctional folylpolyglutamate synthase/dihydrofolate synthase [Bryobacterales bacterium]